MKIPDRILVEADLFISYLTGDELEAKFSELVERAEKGELDLFCSSEVCDDVISALRSQEIGLEEALEFVSDMRAIPCETLPVDPETARKALRLYIDHGGSRKLHYFDSFHVATSDHYSLPLVTSDRYIIEHEADFGIEVVDVRGL